MISAFDLEVRKTVTGFLGQPVDVAMTPRQFAFGFFRNVYFAFVLNANGVVTVFESGPTGFKSFGFDDAIGNLPFPFANATAIRPDPTELGSAFWVTHTGPLGPEGRPTGQPGGALTKVGLVSAIIGVVPINPGERPSFRDYEFGVVASIGEGPDGLTGVPVDLAFDDQRNLGALSGYTTPFSSAPPLAVNSKSAVRSVLGMIRATTTPQFLFVAVPASVEGPGVVDVLEYEGLGRFDTNAFDPGVQSIPTPGVHGLGHWFRP